MRAGDGADEDAGRRALPSRRLWARCAGGCGAGRADCAPTGLRARAVRALADERGISIVFAMILLVVLLIVGGIIVSYAYSGYQRAQQDLADQKAYYNVQSATQLVRDDFDKSKEWARKALDKANDGPVRYHLKMKPNGTAGNSPNESTGQSSPSQPESSSETSPSFDTVTILVQKSSGISYDIICYISNGNNDEISGTAYYFVASKKSDADQINNVSKIGVYGNETN